jgi:hypothetical protein
LPLKINAGLVTGFARAKRAVGATNGKTIKFYGSGGNLPFKGTVKSTFLRSLGLSAEQL